jgi:hypothetical protein
MKTKPFIYTFILTFVTLSGILLSSCKHSSGGSKDEVVAFLNNLNEQIKAGNTDSLTQYFDAGKEKTVTTLIGVLAGKTNLSGRSKPLFKLNLDVANGKINADNPEAITAAIPVAFVRDSIAPGASSIFFTIHKDAGKHFKIYRVNAKNFGTDYMAYQIKVLNKFKPVGDVYNPITLAAFKTAEKLKARYDSIPWFQHVENKTFFYVVKGTLPEDFTQTYGGEDKSKPKSDYKMGLLNPELKEIIPVQFDLIHNVGGTIAGMIEVEKDNKRGLFGIDGKVIADATYDQILPLTDGDNLALLKNGEDYFYLKSDNTISPKIEDFKIADALPMVKTYNSSYTLEGKTTRSIMEHNSKDDYTTLIISPSYLADWQILPKFVNLQNPLRKLSEDEMGEGWGSLSYDVKFNGDKGNNDDNLFKAAYYSVVDNYLGGRSGLYTAKNVLVVDKKQNRVLGFSADTYFGGGEGGGSLSGTCNENQLKAINDSLFEFKTTSQLDQQLLDSTKTISEGPYYHYIQIKNGKLVALKTKRVFPTQFVKMDDSYLQGCYSISQWDYSNHTNGKDITLSNADKEILQCMKNEIYASYNYKFKNPRWDAVFNYRFTDLDSDKKNASVDDSLTTIDKYNINFLNQKINGPKIKSNSLAVR